MASPISVVPTLRADWSSGLKMSPVRRPSGDAISKDLKQRGFRFVGSTIIYAHMQATGMVNDHALDCFRRKELLAE
jgi:3-methyladenine DNA glycosylase Tag